MKYVKTCFFRIIYQEGREQNMKRLDQSAQNRFGELRCKTTPRRKS